MSELQHFWLPDQTVCYHIILWAEKLIDLMVWMTFTQIWSIKNGDHSIKLVCIISMMRDKETKAFVYLTYLTSHLASEG